MSVARVRGLVGRDAVDHAGLQAVDKRLAVSVNEGGFTRPPEPAERAEFAALTG
jgi:hypothetical protein